jgi:serine/threonine-protein kinase
VLYFCLTGQFPFPDGTAAEKMTAHQTKQPTSVRELVPDVPEGLVAIVERLMQKSPEERYGATAEVVEALEHWAKGSSAGRPAHATAARPSTPAVNASRPAQPAKPVAVEEPPRPTNRSSAAPASRPVLTVANLPSRETLLGKKNPATAAVPATKRPSKPVMVEEDVEVVEEDTETAYHARGESGLEARPGWDERLGTLGIAFGAIVVCAVVWFLTWKLF